MKKIILLSTILFAFSACNEILDIQPLDKLSDSNVWSEQNLIELYVNSTYHAVPQSLGWALPAGLSDDIYMKHDNGTFVVQRGQLTPDNVNVTWSIDPPLNYWPMGYKYIRRINVFFEKIVEAPVEQNLKNRLIGEMKFIRGWIYFKLIKRYGGVPIIENVFELGDEIQVSRNTYDECVNYIINELDEAISLLPSVQTEGEKGRASGHAAMALKSRVLLYAASPLNNPSNDKVKWQKAADAAEALLDLGYSLHNDYQTLFLAQNNEIIHARYFVEGIHITAWSARNGSNGNGCNTPSHNLVMDYEMANGQQPYIQVNGEMVVNSSSGYDPQNPYVNRDPRFYASILYDGAVWQGRETETFYGGLDSPQSSIQPWNASETGYYLKKFLDPEIPPDYTITPKTPWIFFRFGEILLNYAEAKFELGEEDTAREYINMIRSRSSVNLPPITASGEELRKKIHHERRIELAFEGHRFYDVRRWKIAMETSNKDFLRMHIIKNEDGSKTYEVKPFFERKFENKHYLLPIPRTEIDRSLDALQQNPGYDN